MRFVCLFILAIAALPAQTTGSFFPLDVGDRWVYRIDDRNNTATYQTWRIDRTAAAGGRTYSVIAIETPFGNYEYYYRVDSSGKVYILTGNGDTLFLDPNVLNQNVGSVQFMSITGPVTNSWGTFAQIASYQNPMGLLYETGQLASGLGLLTSTTFMQSGSSGGTTMIRTLVEATIGKVHYTSAQSGMELSLESVDLDVSGRNVTNCAIPCYFVACGIGGADPTGTYKPCARARVALRNWPAYASRAVNLQLQASDGSIAFDQSLTLDAAPDESVGWVRVLLYSQPNVPIPPGSYKLVAKNSDGSAESTVKITIR